MREKSRKKPRSRAGGSDPDSTLDDTLRKRAYAIWEANESTSYLAAGSGTYTARRKGKALTVTARGLLPRKGLFASLERTRLEPADPDFPGVFLSYLLVFKQCGPLGPSEAVPFETFETLEVSDAVDALVVFDRSGPQRVVVTKDESGGRE